MFKKRFVLLLLLPAMLFGEYISSVQNTNITLFSEDDNFLYNYERLRFRSDLTRDDLFATVIVDAINYLGDDYLNSEDFTLLQRSRSDTPFNTQTTFKEYGDGSVYARVYRAYGGYEDGFNRVVIGLQNITMGVGRIWTPTNLYNPKNSYAIEQEEVFGVAAVLYTRYINDTSHLSVILSEDADEKIQYGARYKGYLYVADFALDVVVCEDTTMIGYEMEANIGDSGIELRSEGVYIQTTLYGADEEEFFQAIVGVDYGFENGVDLVLEALYSSQSFSYETILQNTNSQLSSNLVDSDLYLGSMISYDFNIFLNLSLLYIGGFADEYTHFISPVIEYTLDDYNSFSLGAMVQSRVDNNYFLQYELSF